MHFCVPDFFLLNAEFHNAVIVNVVTVTPLLKRFFIQFPFPVEFSSGQFVIIDFGELPHQYSTRSYSVADFTKGNTIELCVSLKEDGAATPILFHQKPGDALMVSLPQGRFVLPEVVIVPVIGFICTGTGVAPFRAMIKDLLIHRQYKGIVYLFFGCRYEQDILYRTEFESLEIDYPNFRYTPVLSRGKWNGAEGYVHAHYPAVFASKPEALIYLCGWTDMLKETRDRLKAYGYTRQDIKIEFYD